MKQPLRLWYAGALLVALFSMTIQRALSLPPPPPCDGWCDGWNCTVGSVNNPGTLSVTNGSVCMGGSISSVLSGTTFINGSKSRQCHDTCGGNWTDGPYPVIYAGTNWWEPSLPSTFSSAGTFVYTNKVMGLALDGDCTSPTAAVVSGTLTVTVTSSPPVIVSQPTNQTVVVGSNALFTVVATGCPNIFYQWRFNGTNVIAGATNASLSITNVQCANAGDYTVVVSNTSGSITSSPARLITIAADQQPNDVTVTYGQSATFCVQASACPTRASQSGSFTYQWQRNGINLPGATSSCCTISSPVVADSGTTYRVIVGYGSLSITSRVATLTVNRAVLALTADSLTKQYGAANPALTWHATGFVFNENTGVLAGSPQLSTAVTTNSIVGSYPITITQGTLACANYSFLFGNGSLIVAGAPLVIRANGQTREYGLTNPPFTWAASGFVNGESTNVLSGSPQLASIATTNSNVGVYGITITAGTLAATNYVFDLVGGNLVVTKAPLAVVANNQTKSTGSTNPPLTGSINGVRNNDNISATFNTLATIWSLAGTYPIFPLLNDPAGKLANYNTAMTNGTLIVVDGAPNIISQAESQKQVNLGASISLRAICDAAAPVSYKWKKNGTNITDANVSGTATNWLTISNFVSANAGSYTLVVSNALGTSTSAPAALVVGSFSNSCTNNLYPIGLPRWVLTNAPGTNQITITGGATSGSFLWLTWDGNGNTPTLERDLTIPGDSYRYINPSNAEDHVISINDWMQTSTGISGAVDSYLQTLTNYCGTNTIELPAWYNDPQGTGANGSYQYYNYATVKLLNYDITSSTKSITISYWGSVQCEPTAFNWSTTNFTYVENQPPVIIDPAASISDFTVGTMAISIVTNRLPEDRLSINSQGTLVGQITVSGTNVLYYLTNNVPTQIATFSGGIGTNTLAIEFNNNATIEAVTAVARNLTYQNLSDNPSTLTRTVSAVLSHAGTGNIQAALIYGNIIPVNDPPVVSIVTPTNWSTFGAGIPVQITAAATDIDGSVSSVKFYNSASNLDAAHLIGTVFTPAFSSNYLFTWTNAPFWTNAVTAVATDNQGATNASAPVFFVVAPQPPTIQITKPSDGASFAAPALIRIETLPQDLDGTVTNVTFFTNGIRAGFATNYPFYLTLTNIGPGSYTIGATVMDNNGLSNSASPVSITVQSCSGAAVNSLTLSTNRIQSGGNLTGTVNLLSPAMTGGQAIDIHSDNASVIIPDAVFIPEGANSAVFAIASRISSATNTVTLSASYQGEAAHTAFLTVDGQNGSGTNVTQHCGPMDVVFVIDTTGSMGTTLENIKSSITNTLNDIVAASAGDYRLALVTFNGTNDDINCMDPDIDHVYVQQVLAPTNRVTVAAMIAGLGANGGNDDPECSDEALNTVINTLSATGRNQCGDFNTPFRSEARKIIILVTDNVPGGFYDGGAYYYADVIQSNDVEWTSEAVAKGIEISTVNVTHGGSLSWRDQIMHYYADTTGGIYTETADGTEAGQSIDAILAQCGGSVANLVFVRDDVSENNYTAIGVNDSQRIAASSTPAVFDLRNVSGSTFAAHIERAGQLRRNLGTHFDLEWGVASVGSSNLNSFGSLQTNAQLLPAYYGYDFDWELPFGFYSDLDSQLGGAYSLKFEDRISSLCGNTVQLQDQPNSDWPVVKNVLTFMVSGSPDIPQSRCRDIVLAGADAPLNGSWDIVFNGQIIASSGQANGWSIEDDHTLYGGVNIAVPSTAAVASSYEVRLSTAAAATSSFFNVVSSNMLNSAPVLLPLQISNRSVTNGVPVTVTVTLDAPATGNGAFVALKWDGVSGGVLPPYIVIPAGQRTNKFVFTSQTNIAFSDFTIDASYNGYRRSSMAIQAGKGAVPGTPTNLVAIPGDGQITLNWTNAVNAASYNVKRALTSGGPYTLLFEGLTTTNYVDVQVQNGTSYYYVVSAVNKNGESPNSSQVSATPNAPIAVAKPLIQPAGGSFNDSVVVTITDPTAGAEIWYTLDGSLPQQNAATSTQYTVPFTLTSTVTVRAAAFMSGAVDSSVARANFTVIGKTPLNCDSTNSYALTASSSYSTNRGLGFYTGRFSLTGVAGRQATITMTSTNFDTYLYLNDPTGAIVATNDDAQASGLPRPSDSQIIYTFKTSGTYYVEATSFYPAQTGAFQIGVKCQDSPELGILYKGLMLPNNGFIDFGVTNVGSNVTQTITITNSGTATLNVSNITAIPAGTFSVAPPTVAPIVSAGSVNLALTFNPAAQGQYNAYLYIWSDEGDNGDGIENPFIVSLIGRANIAGTAPTVTLTSPTAGQTLVASAQVTLSANVVQGSSSVSNVVFYAQTGNSQTPIGTATASPYSATWNNVAGGSYTITAIATDVAGRVAASGPVSIFVDTPPEANADTARVSLNSTANPITVLSNDSDADGDTLAVTGNSTPSHGTVTRSGNTIYYTPASNYSGTDSFTYTISDGHGGTAVGTVNVKIPPSTIPPLPVAIITAPSASAGISSPTNIIGTAACTNVDQTSVIDSYQVQIRRTGDDSSPWRTIITGTTNVIGGTLGTLDPTLMLNGSYDIQLIVEDLAGQQTVSESVTITLMNNMKVGAFTLAFNDLQIPIGNLPISVTRTYDSRNQTVGDFGVGWTLAVGSIHLEQNMSLGENWFGVEASGFFPYYYLQDGGPHLISITFPDGKTERFVPVPLFSNGNPYTYFSPQYDYIHFKYQPLPGTYGTLSATALNDLVVPPGPYDDYTGEETINEDGSGYGDGPIFNPSGFTYTTQDGRVFQFDANGKVTQMSDRNGNTITFNSDGIIHSSGKSIKFVRDSQGRITSVYDPNALDASGTPVGPPVLIYKYDDISGNLVSVNRLVDRSNTNYLTTSFAYTNANFPNYLTSVKDQGGNIGIRNVYDDDGRLVASTDADGNTSTYSHDLDNTTEVVVDKLGNTNTYVYDLRGNIVSQTDALGNLTTKAYDDNNRKTNEVNYQNSQAYATNSYIYDDNGFLATAVNPLGFATTFVNNQYGQPEIIWDARGNATTNKYDNNGNLIATTDPLGGVTFNSFEAGLLVGSIDSFGNTTTNYYDTFQNVKASAILDASGTILSSNTFGYDANNNRTNSTVWRRVNGSWVPATTMYVFDAQNRIVQTINPDGGTLTDVYNAIGKRQARIDELGRTITYVYDPIGRLIQTAYPDGTSETSVYDGNGNRTQGVDRAGRTITYQYDALNRLRQTVYPDGATVSTVYDAVGRVAQSINSRGAITAFAYDAAGQQIAVTNGFNSTLQTISIYRYDANGNVIESTDANNNTITNVYDALNRVVEVDYSDGNKSYTGYNFDGLRIAETNQDNIVTRFGYDGAGRLTSVTNAFGTPQQAVTRYTYDEAGNKITQTDALGRTNQFGFDGVGRRILHTIPGGQSEGFAYDKAGNIVYQTNFNSAIITNQYDSMNRLTNVLSANGYHVSYTYTATGQRWSMTDASGTTTYVYDIRNRLQTKMVNWSGGPNATLNYRYDINGEITNLWSSTSGGLNLVYGYDSLDRLTNVLANGNLAASYAFDNVGNLQGMTYANGITNSFQYDRLNRLTNLVWRSNTGVLAGFSYQLGRAGSRSSLAETINAVSRTYTWQYDSLYRLTNENISAVGNVAYGYDLVGNRTNRISGITGLTNQAFTFNTNDWLNTDTYDADGSTTASGGNSYRYDVLDRLTNVNNGQILITYDGDGNRASKTIGGTTTYYLTDDHNPSGYVQVLEEYQGSSLIRVYNYGLNLISQRQAGVSTNYFIFDGHGSTRVLTDAGGGIVNVFAYDAYGVLVVSNATPQTAYLYSGQQYDSDLKLYLNRARYLNTGTGRFWTRDTYPGHDEDPISLHKYLYANADPIDIVDPSGHDGDLPSLTAATGIGATVAGLTGEAVVTAETAAEVSILESEAAVEINAARTALTEAFESEEGTLIGRAFRQFGKVAENAAKRVIKTALGETVEVEEGAAARQGGKRFLDFVLKQIGKDGKILKVLKLEVKYNMPKAGPQLARLAAQVEESVAAGDGQTVVWSLRAPTQAAMQAVENALGQNFSKVVFKSGVRELLTYLRTFF